jgi:hypothetical protein
MIRGVAKLRIADLLWNKTLNSLNPTVTTAMTNNAFNQHRRFIYFVKSASNNLHKKGHPDHNPLQKVQPVIACFARLRSCIGLLEESYVWMSVWFCSRAD